MKFIKLLIFVLALASLADAQGIGGKAGFGGKAGVGGGTGGGGGSLAVDSQMPSSAATYNAAQTSPKTFSFTNTAGNVLYVAATNSNSSAVTSVTYNGVSMTQLGVTAAANGSGGKIQLYRLSSPATGSNTVSVSFTGGGTPTVMAAAISLSGANATPDTGTATTANDLGGTATAFTVVVPSTVSGNIVLEAACFGDPSYSSVNGTLSANTAANPDGSATCNNFALQDATTAGGSKTMTVNGTTTTSWAALGIAVTQ